MKTLTHLFTTLSLLVCCVHISFAQIVGGRENSQSTPKVAEATKLSGGTFSGDVNNMTGEYQASIPLGSVGTPGGISYTLSIEHNSSFSIGTNDPLSSGLNYGEGWSLSLPTISIETDVFHRFSNTDECGDNTGSPNTVNTNRMSSSYGKDWEGDLFWFAPTISIPGVASGRAVFKYVDVDDDSCSVFVLNKFETPVEIRFYGNSWIVQLADGTRYHFEPRTVITEYRAPSNKRLLDYDHNLFTYSSSYAEASVEALLANEYSDSTSAIIKNVVEPKKYYSTWYCSQISNTNLWGQNIVFNYERYGNFNFFGEFSQPNYGNVHDSVFKDMNGYYLPDYSTYRDILLKNITSYVIDGNPVDILELEYDRLEEAYVGSTPLLNPEDEDVTIIDPMYCSEVVYSAVEDEFGDWYRYPHHNRDGGNELTIPSNPYLRYDGDYFREQVGSNGNAPFDHGYLESPRLMDSQLHGAGDVYEVRTHIIRPSGTDLRNGNGTIDIAIVTSDGDFPYSSDLSGTIIADDAYRNLRGEEIFSTFNMALKWQMGYGQTSIQTSNFFVMPNLPSTFGGFNIQVGPGNSEIDYSFYDNTLLYQNLDPNNSTGVNGSNALAAYPQLATTSQIKPAGAIPRYFGTGHPWGMMAPIFNCMAAVGANGSTLGLSHEENYKGSWSMSNSNIASYGNHHNPTKFDETVELTSVELVRYSKMAYMLQGVKQYKINGEYGSIVQDGKKLVAQKKLDYEVEYVNRITNKYYELGVEIEMETASASQRQTILLSEIHDVPVEGDLYEEDFDLPDPDVVLSTKLEYENIIPTIVGTVYYTEIKPYQGLSHYALTKFTDYLGGETMIEYYPLDAPETRVAHNNSRKWICGNMYSPRAYGSSETYTIHLVVKYISKTTENYDVSTDQYVNPVHRWEYQYFESIYNRKQMYLPATHFRGDFSHKVDIAFGRVRVYAPKIGTVGNMTEYEYYGADFTGGQSFPSESNFLLYGKLKSVKEFASTGELHSSTEYDYEYTKAYENGYFRPNFLREGIRNYDHLWFDDYEYKDYYKDQEMTIDNSLGQVIPGGPTTITGDLARQILAPRILKDGKELTELPKFMPFVFMEELLDNFIANDIKGGVVGSVTNPEYFFNSYFIKKASETKRVYENGLSKASTGVIPVFPVVDAVPNNPFGTGTTNPVIPDFPVDSALISKISLLGDGALTDLVNASPLSDDVLIELLNSGLIAAHKMEVLALQDDFSNQVWIEIIDNQGTLSPIQLHQLVYQQSYFSDAIQDYLIDNAQRTDDDLFFQSLLLRNPKLSDDIAMNLCRATNSPGESFRIVLAGQTHQFSAAVLGEIVDSPLASNQSVEEIFSDQQLADSDYLDLINDSGVATESIVRVIESTPVKPSDDLIEDFIDLRSPSYSEIQRVVDVLERDLSTSLLALLDFVYTSPTVTKPLNPNPLSQFCSNELDLSRTYIETKTEYDYYEADYRGVAQGKAFEVLFGKIESIDEPSAYPQVINHSLFGGNKTIPHLQLKHEPSWQVFAVKTSSPHLPDAVNREEYFYYYDLQNRYDRIWYNYDLDNAFLVPFEYEDGSSNPLDTFVYNENYTEYYYTQDIPFVPKFDGMSGAREYGLRSLAYQKTTFSKNTRDVTGLRRSEYYDYDRRWFYDDLVSNAASDTYSGPPCTPPGQTYDCDDCFYENHVFTSEQIAAYQAAGYCLWEATPGSDWPYDYYICEYGVDMTECNEDVVAVQCTETEPEGGSPGSGYIVVGTQLSKSLQLRDVTIQLDTILQAGTGSFANYRIDTDNDYIVEFRMEDPDDYDANGYLGGEYEMVLPFEALTVRTIDERNRHFQPELERNQMDLKTRYYYNTVARTNYQNTNCETDVQPTVTSYNTGLPYRITVGYTRSDSLSTAYEYTDAAMLKKVTEPTGKYIEYTFDGYQRLVEIKENGTRILSETAYHLWDDDELLDFQERTAQNYVKSTLFNSGSSGDFEMNRVYVDPLGRNHSSITSYEQGDLINHLYSGSIIYDNWNRTIRMHKNFAIVDNFDQNPSVYEPTLISDYTLEHTDIYFENNPKNRAKRAANFGVDINDPANHVVRTEYFIANNVYTSCELGLTGSELPLIMKGGSTSDCRFLRISVWDQDNKQSVEYTNALGQKVASLKYNDGNEKIVTLFVYDSYGNLTKTINANKQHSDYSYNILGQLYKEQTVDAGVKKYMYNKQGLASVILDQQGFNHLDTNQDADPFYRVFKYDIYGRLLNVGRSAGPVNYNMYAYFGPLFYDNVLFGEGTDIPENYDYSATGNYIEYDFTNRSTQDWLVTYKAWSPTIPGLITLSGLHNAFSIATMEKGYTYGNNTVASRSGKINETHSYNNEGALVQKISHNYDAVGNISSQEIYFNPDQQTGVTPVFPDPAILIDYPAYNYRAALLEQKVDVDGDHQTDLHYFYDYDPLNRLIGVYAAKEEVNGKEYATLIVGYEYDDATGLLTVKRHSIDFNASSILVGRNNYSYDERDRITNISLSKEDSPSDLGVMGYKLYYDNEQPYINFGQTDPLQYHENWNGNINGSTMIYDFSHTLQTPVDFDHPVIYGYQYDKINRLIKADAMVGDYIEDATPTQLNESYRIGDVGIFYDRIGNITSLLRSYRSEVPTEMMAQEHFLYHYTGATNRLYEVEGQAGTSDRYYTYDQNGNLLTDSYRDIDATNYGRAAYAFNVTTDDSEIAYLYSVEDQRMFKEVATSSEVTREYYLSDAFGKVLALRKEVTPSGQSTATSWEYYVHGSEREARLEKQNSDPRFSDEEVSFFVYDHLGNTRINYTPDIEEQLAYDDVLFEDDFAGSSIDNWTAGGSNSIVNIGGGINVSNSSSTVVCSKSFTMTGGKSYTLEINAIIGTVSGVDVIVNATPMGALVTGDNIYTFNGLTTANVSIILVGAGSGDFVIRAAKLTETTPYSLTTDMQINYVADYFPYGKVLREYINVEQERYLTTQHERDQETELDYRGARYYDSDIARFLSLDPKSRVYPSISPYCYAGNSPIAFVDENGEGPIHPGKGYEITTGVFTVSDWEMLEVDQTPMKESKYWDYGLKLAGNINADAYSDDTSYGDSYPVYDRRNFGDQEYRVMIKKDGNMVLSENLLEHAEYSEGSTHHQGNFKNMVSGAMSGNYTYGEESSGKYTITNVVNNWVRDEAFFSKSPDGVWKLTSENHYEVSNKRMSYETKVRKDAIGIKTTYVLKTVTYDVKTTTYTYDSEGNVTETVKYSQIKFESIPK